MILTVKKNQINTVKILMLLVLFGFSKTINAQNTNNLYQQQQKQLQEYNQRMQQEKQYYQNGTYTPQKRGYTNQEIINQQKAKQKATENRKNPYYKPKLKAGTMTYNGASFGSFSDGWVKDVGGGGVAYLNKNGYFYSRNQQCLGGVKGYNIVDCQGYVVYKVQQGAVYDNRGYVLCSINGEQLKYSNGQIITIAQLDMHSLGAYLLVFK